MRGTNVHPVWWDLGKAPTFDARAQAITAGGYTHVRFDVPWALLQSAGTWASATGPAQGGALDPLYLARLDAAVAAFTKAGLTMICVITTAPPWATGRSDGNVQAPPLTNETWAAFATQLQARWPSVQIWECWNEPSAATTWVGGDVRRYGELLRWGAGQLRKRYPKCVILGGSIHQTIGAEPLAFLGELLQRGYGKDMDALSVHSYGDGYVHGNRWPFEVVRDVLRLNTGGLPVWVTETGWHTGEGGADPQKQAYAFAETHRQIAAQDPGGVRIKLAVEYEWADDRVGSSRPEDCYGVVHPVTLQPKWVAA